MFYFAFFTKIHIKSISFNRIVQSMRLLSGCPAMYR